MKKDTGRWIKHNVFFYLLPFLLLQTDKLRHREHRVIQTSQHYCRSTNKSLTNTNNKGANKKRREKKQHLATINILEKTSEVKKGVHSAFLIVNSVSTSSWTRLREKNQTREAATLLWRRPPFPPSLAFFWKWILSEAPDLSPAPSDGPQHYRGMWCSTRFKSN